MAKSPTLKQSLGQFFTPEQIVKYILENISLTSGNTIADISCGNGAFLIQAFNELNKLKQDEISTLSQIYGIELSNSKLNEAQKRILNHCRNKKCKSILKKNLLCMNTVTNTVEEILDVFPSIKQSSGFDVIVGNPPYVTIKIEKDLRKDHIFSQIISGQLNITTLMIGRAFSLLKCGGKLGLLLPKSLFRVSSYQKLRNFLLSYFEFDYLIDVGISFKGVRGEQVIFIGTKKNNPSSKKSVKIGTWYQNNSSKPSLNTVLQENIIRFGIFQFFDNPKTYALTSKIIREHPSLESICNGKIYRGIPIGANSSFVTTIPKKGYKKALRGDSIKKFGFEYILYIKNQNYPKLTDEIQSKKIVVQNIFSSESGIIANYDDIGMIPLDTVTNIFPYHSEPHYVLGILNSKLARFFMIFVVYAKSRLTMHTDKDYIGLLPIPKINSKLKDDIIKQVNFSLEGKKSNKIDELVFKAYGLSNEEKQLIDIELVRFERNGKKSK